MNAAVRAPTGCAGRRPGEGHLRHRGERLALGQRAARLATGLLLLAALGGCPPRTVARRPPVVLEAHPEPDLVGVNHQVQPGETLWRISRAYDVPIEELMVANHLEDASRLVAGQPLFIPGARAPRPVGPPPPAAPSEPAAPPAPRPAKVEPASGRPLEWPLIGVLYARFGKRGETRHDGVDVSAPEGTFVRAAADGEVLFSAEQRGYGHLVILEHAGGLLTVYAHNRKNLVREGDRVVRGQPIAEVGAGTRTSGPHLHFEVREKGLPQDPLRYLPPPR